MSRPVTLTNSDFSHVYGNVLLPSVFPSDPPILIWKGKYFQAGNISYAPTPGSYENYSEVPSLTIPDADVVDPAVAPTKVV